MFGLISKRRYNKDIQELIREKISLINEVDKKLAQCQQECDKLQKYNNDIRNKLENSKTGSLYGAANHRINLSFYYNSNHDYSCRVTFTPELFDSTSTSVIKTRFGWDKDGRAVENELEVIRQIFKEFVFNNWRWSDTDNKPVSYFRDHDIAAITEAVGKFNGELQQHVNNILKAEQYLRISRANEPKVS